MAADSLRRLAGELKHFLAAQEEDEFIVTAASNRAAAVVLPAEPKPAPAGSSLPPMLEGETLTVEFARAQQALVPAVHPAAEAAQPAETISTQEAPMNTAQKTAALAELAETIKSCSRCPLGATRLNAVPGEGNVDAKLMFVGEGPGFDEDRQGRPFVGRAGQLLDKMIAAMGLKREEVFIANIAKCHPMTDPLHPEKHGNDRAPNAQEIACCRKYIEKQISIICPEYVVALGGVSAKALIADAKSLSALRGKFYDLHLDSVTLPKPVKILATFHPAALLRNPGWKKDAWQDLQMVMAKLGLKGLAK
ncbi:MAG: uracil-DNA glycosylase [Elusimicrobia bacterium]|nr:uracil-DNA glycosylase [Elusimicrobiota bacterium]MDY5729852.1 uracil-DNA glycosylase [Elusimicrobiaceae bacterium]